ncbi:Porin [Synechococcus sp. RCC307]|nr:Porin [Synechococcus sp. RCC307]
MNLFQQLMLAPAALGLVAPMGAMAGELNFGGVSKYASADEQVTSISQFSDVYPTDWAYQALANLIERYGCVAGYPNGTFQGNRALSRYEAAALLNACLDRVTEITDEVRRLMKAFEKELAVVKARVDGLEAAVGELEATQFSTTTKLKGKVRFIQGSAYRGDGYVRFGRLKNVMKAAQLYGIRTYDGSTGGLQDRTVNKIKDGKSNGEAYYYYLRDPDNGAKGSVTTQGFTDPTAPASFSLDKQNARQVAFATSWNGVTPANETSGMETRSGVAGSGLYTNANGTIAPVGDTNMLIVPTIAGLGNGSTNANGSTNTVNYAPDRSRMSLYFKDGQRTDNSYGVGADQFLISTQGVKSFIGQDSFLRARNFFEQDKFGNTQKLRVQTSNSGSSNYKAKSIQFDKADYGALINLANKARRVKAYDYYVLPNQGTTSINGLTKVTKAAGVPDPVKISDVQRGYVAVLPEFTSNAAATTAILSGYNSTGMDDRNGGASFVVAPGGYVQSNTAFNNVSNYLIAEYGSLGSAQRNTGYVKKAAQLFVRSLAAYPANKNGVADRNAFTFGHDAQLNFNTSFTGKDKLNFRLRSNTIYSFAKRVNAPFADLAFDGSLPENWKGKHKVFVDKLYYKFPVGDWGKVSFGTRAPQDSFLPSRGTMYTKDALLEFFNTSAGVFPSYTGTGAGVGISRFGGKKLKIANGTVGFGIGYLTAEGDAANPASYNYLQEGLFGRDTRFRLPVQLAWKSKDKKWLFTANYAYERGNNSMGKVGTELAKNPFGASTLIESNQYGFTLAYKWSKQFQITGAYGGASMNSRYDSSILGIDMVNAGDSAQTSSWMIGLNFKDVFIQGNKAGFAIGGVPTVNSNDSGWGTDGSMPIALETWYQFQVTDNISVTPGVFWVSGQNDEKTGRYGQVTLEASNGDVWGGIVKTEFKF